MDASGKLANGFAVRPGWHCSYLPYAPHLGIKGRTWIEVEVKNFRDFERPAAQGGVWILSNWMKVRRILTFEEVAEILKQRQRENQASG